MKTLYYPFTGDNNFSIRRSAISSHVKIACHGQFNRLMMSKHNPRLFFATVIDHVWGYDRG
jgi:hypothetical protein